MTASIRTTTALAIGTTLATLVSAVVLSTLAPAETLVVHELPRVVVTGQVQRDAAPRVVELPRVVVTGRRVDSTGTPASTAMAQAGRIAASGV
jgi:hypothetical protein